MSALQIILSLLGLGAGAFGLLYVWANWHERRQVPDTNPGGPLAFGSGPRTTWLAIRDAPAVAELAASLRLGRPRPIGWPVGLYRAFRAQGRAVFITPAIGPWTFIVNDEMRVSRARLAEISGKTGTEVQWFEADQGHRSYSWGRAVAGRLVRWYVHPGMSDGESVGEPDDRETQVLDRYAVEGDAEASEHPWSIDARVVCELAGAWSADPSAFARETPAKVGPGWIAAWH